MTSQWDTWRCGSPGVDPVDRCRVRGVEGGSVSGARHGARRRPSAFTNVAEMSSTRAWSICDAESRHVSVGGCGSQVARSPRGPWWTADVNGRCVVKTTCGTDGSLPKKEKREAADELASLEAALSALGATRGTTQIAQELREEIANKKKTLAATSPLGLEWMAAERGPQGARHDETRLQKRSNWRQHRWRKPTRR